MTPALPDATSDVPSTSVAARARRALLPLVLAGLAYGHVRTQWLHWRCPVARLSRHPCPTCGMTTATQYVLQGRFAEAWHAHPLVFMVVPLVATLAALELGTFVWTGRFEVWTRTKAARGAVLVAALALFVLWIARFFGALGGPVVIE